MRKALLLSVALAAVAVLAAGCTTFYQRFSTLEVGMTKDQALKHMEEDPNVMDLNANGDGEIIWRADRPQPAIAVFKGYKLTETRRYKIE